MRSFFGLAYTAWKERIIVFDLDQIASSRANRAIEVNFSYLLSVRFKKPISIGGRCVRFSVLRLVFISTWYGSSEWFKRHGISDSRDLRDRGSRSADGSQCVIAPFFFLWKISREKERERDRKGERACVWVDVWSHACVVHARDASRVDCRNSRRINNRDGSARKKNRRGGGKTRGARKGTLPPWVQWVRKE